MHFKTQQKRAFWIVLRVESLILGHVNAKLFRNVIRACAFWKCALKPCMGQSARTAQWEQNITLQRADPDRDWKGVCNTCECTQFKSRSQSRFGSRSKTSFGTWFVLMWTQPLSLFTSNFNVNFRKWLQTCKC